MPIPSSSLRQTIDLAPLIDTFTGTSNGPFVTVKARVETTKRMTLADSGMQWQPAIRVFLRPETVIEEGMLARVDGPKVLTVREVIPERGPTGRVIMYEAVLQ